jgi:hypothetical protein
LLDLELMEKYLYMVGVEGVLEAVLAVLPPRQLLMVALEVEVVPLAVLVGR